MFALFKTFTLHTISLLVTILKALHPPLPPQRIAQSHTVMVMMMVDGGGGVDVGDNVNRDG